MKQTFIDPLLRSFSLTSPSPRPSALHPGKSLRNFKILDDNVYDTNWKKIGKRIPSKILVIAMDTYHKFFYNP